MTKFLKGYALLACLLSSMSVTAIADSEFVRGDLYDEIIRRQGLKKEITDQQTLFTEANGVEYKICTATAYCNENNKLNKIPNLGSLLNRDKKLQTMRKDLISKHRWTSVDHDKVITESN